MKPIPIGQLRHRLQFQEETETTNSRGGKDKEWVDSFKMWGSVVPQSGMPYQVTDYFEPVSTHRIYVRFNSKVERRLRIRHKTDYYSITAIKVHQVADKRYMELLCTQQDTTV